MSLELSEGGLTVAAKTVLTLNILSAGAAFGAAVFWFRSAARDLPPLRAYWDRAPPDDPLFQALQAGVHDNRIAALLAGISAILMALATLAQIRAK